MPAFTIGEVAKASGVGVETGKKSHAIAQGAKVRVGFLASL